MNRFLAVSLVAFALTLAGCGPAQIAIAAIAGGGAGGGVVAIQASQTTRNLWVHVKPTVTIISGPVNGSFDLTPTFHWIGNDIDGYIISYLPSIDSRQYGSTGNTSWTAPELEAGRSHTFSVIAVDHSGGTSDSASWNWQIAPSGGPSDITIRSIMFVSGDIFSMGDSYGIGDPDETPPHPVFVDDFNIAYTETTNQQFAVFLNDGNDQYYVRAPGQQIERHMNGSFIPLPGKEDFPAVHVSWEAATAYCQWMSSKTADTWRLPTEAEWELAARGGAEYRLYPTGDSINGLQANFRNSGDEFESGDYPWTAPVKVSDTGIDSIYNPTGYGYYNMAGNVWEWCSDYYDPDYYTDCLGAGTMINPTGPASGTMRIMRGGSWNNGTYSMRCPNRHAGMPDGADMFTGFRCVKEP
ncbi:MAG: hypothetical protein E3J72_20145 [Planctomycetota bacterium]|nr:MAG: hypothetical protein E3J72_20145 [Planctomycetota bacterium]